MPEAPEKAQRTGAKGNSAAPRRAFLATPAGADTRVLRNALARRGIESLSADEMDMPGRSISEVLQESIGAADLVIAALDPRLNNSNVFLELGLALGLDKRLLLLSPTAEVLPGITLTGMPTIRATLQDAERIEFGLDQVLAAPKRREGPKKKPQPQTHPIGALSERLVGEITADVSPQRLEEIVRTALAESGIATASGPKDEVLAVWSDDLEPWVGNPLLVEIKANVRTPAQLGEALEQMKRGVAERGTTWGLLLYSGPLDGHPPGPPRGSPVLAISVTDFLRALSKEGFADVVRRLRNERVHGRG
jgi:hypothetical protein